jgi:hypothetical protein
MKPFLQSGFSLVQGLILSAVVAGSGLVATRILIDQKATQRGASTRDAIEQFDEMIFATLADKANCRRTITANGKQIEIVGAFTQVNLNEIWTANSTTPIAQVGSEYMNNSFRIKSISVGQRSTYGVSSGVLSVVYERNNPSARTGRIVGAKEVRKKHVFFIQKRPYVGGSGLDSFDACYTEELSKIDLNGQQSAFRGSSNSMDLCYQLIGIANPWASPNVPAAVPADAAFEWDSVRNICKLRTSCPAGRVYTGIDTNGRLRCQMPQDWVDYNNILDATPPASCPIGSQVGFQIIGNKVRIRCN